MSQLIVGSFFVNIYMNSLWITFATLIFKILDLSRELLHRYDDWKRNRKIKKQYRRGKKAVKDGNIDEINKILK